MPAIFSTAMKDRLNRAAVRGAATALLTALSAFEARPAQRAVSGNSEEALPVLKSIQKAYTAAPSYTANFVQTYTPAGFAAAAPETGRLTLQSPDRVRFDYDGPEGKLFAFDGKAARQYVAADRQMIVKTLSPADRERLPLLFFESPETLTARYRVAAAPGENGLTELKLASKAGGEPAQILLSVAPSGDVKRLVVTDAAGNRTAFTFSQKAAGTRLPDGEFAPAPPPGTKVLSD